MSQVDSRYNGCVVIGALRARSAQQRYSWVNSILAALEISLCWAIRVRQSLPTAFKKDRLKPAGAPTVDARRV
jgi:hypothetical protein